MWIRGLITWQLIVPALGDYRSSKLLQLLPESYSTSGNKQRRTFTGSTRRGQWQHLLHPIAPTWEIAWRSRGQA
ncbi:hypothetical protein P691DRAFT_529796 [Macrolepiota fuliginosa MF-IS2]|uniref:Uncharacterized protein n=1 Tax=Macrolepiota fuliginosa MF-IS2 TaxID=1400762 RepID=A0A9P5XQN0_9AGAR|nr:hypothetical protein P691DRAFT_529796 [Macrolepiota fuliginosa MF-IS2]